MILIHRVYPFEYQNEFRYLESDLESAPLHHPHIGGPHSRKLAGLYFKLSKFKPYRSYTNYPLGSRQEDTGSRIPVVVILADPHACIYLFICSGGPVSPALCCFVYTAGPSTYSFNLLIAYKCMWAYQGRSHGYTHAWCSSRWFGYGAALPHQPLAHDLLALVTMYCDLEHVHLLVRLMAIVMSVKDG